MDVNHIFSREALDKMRSPEKLDRMLQITNPIGWMGLIAVGVVMFSVIWALWEKGLNGWAMIPRLVGPLVLMLLVLATLPVLRSRGGGKTAGRALHGAADAVGKTKAALSPRCAPACAASCAPVPSSRRPAWRRRSSARSWDLWRCWCC